MRILVVTHRFPYPADKGDRIRGFTWLEALGQEHCVDLLTFADKDVTHELICALREKTKIERIFPVRVNGLGCFFYGAISAVSGFSLTEGYFYSHRFEQQLKELLRLNKYDVCVAVCSSVGSYFSRVSCSCRVIMDFVDVDSYKWFLYGEYVSGVRGLFYRRESEKLVELERKLAGLADEVVVITPSEARKLEFSDVKVIGNPVRSCSIGMAEAEFFGEANRIVFVGQMDYFPNVDAVCWFSEEVWPEISCMYDDLRFVIVGRNPSRKVRKLSRLRNVDVVGRVDNVRDYLHSSISVIPLRIVCGLQNKLLESLSSGVPVVCSSGVAESAGIEEGEGVLVADSVSDWVLSISRLKENPEFASRLGIEGKDAVIERFSKREIYGKMLGVVDGLSGETEEGRVALVC